MEAVLLKEPAYFSCAVGSGFCGRQPAFDLRGQVVRRCDGIRLQPGVAEELQQLAERECADVR